MTKNRSLGLLSEVMLGGTVEGISASFDIKRFIINNKNAERKTKDRL